MINDKKIVVGKVISAFGIKGFVKIISFCQEPLEIEKYRCFNEKGEEFSVRIANKNKAVTGFTKSGDAILIAEISTIKDRNKAEEARSMLIYTTRDQFGELDEDEFYQTDLIGLDLVDKTGQKIGKVLNVFDFGAGEMLEIELLEEFRPKNCEKIENFAFKNEFFGEIDVKNGKIEFLGAEIDLAKE